jgi:fatty-acyl-CoA synthase
MPPDSHDDAPLPWVHDETVGSVLRKTARRYPNRDAIVFPKLNLRWSWAEFDRRVDTIASGLIALGIEPGENVGIWAMNSPEWVLTQFAVGRIGSVLVNINPSYRLHELEEALRQADIRTLIVGLPFKFSNFVEMVESMIPEVRAATSMRWSSTSLPELRRLIAVGTKPGEGWSTWSDLEATAPSRELVARDSAVKSTDIHNIQFTSGTTGLPKGAMLTHRNVLMNAYYVGQRTRYTENDRVCVPVPFYHCFGCVLGNLVCAVYGSAIVAPAPSFDAGATLDAISSERCTSVYGVPTMFTGMLDHEHRHHHDTSSLRTGIMAGSPCPLPLMHAVMEQLGAREITIGYGLTEASPIITQTDVDDPPEIRSGTVGRPLPGVEVRLLDPKSGQLAEPGRPGELCARGHGVMAGYYKNPEATARTIDADGWLKTGDLAIARDDGTYRIVGRSKELIIRGGENIYPPEIEEYLHHHPAIAEVAIVGLPDPHYGEVVSAWIVCRPNASIVPDDVRCFCHGQIAHFKVPKYVDIIDSMPKTVTGKIRKHVLRELGVERYNLSQAASIETA